jgi:hypothetical protein
LGRYFLNKKYLEDFIKNAESECTAISTIPTDKMFPRAFTLAGKNPQVFLKECVAQLKKDIKHVHAMNKSVPDPAPAAVEAMMTCVAFNTVLVEGTARLYHHALDRAYDHYTLFQMHGLATTCMNNILAKMAEKAPDTIFTTKYNEAYKELYDSVLSENATPLPRMKKFEVFARAARRQSLNIAYIDAMALAKRSVFDLKGDTKPAGYKQASWEDFVTDEREWSRPRPTLADGAKAAAIVTALGLAASGNIPILAAIAASFAGVAGLKPLAQKIKNTANTYDFSFNTDTGNAEVIRQITDKKKDGMFYDVSSYVSRMEKSDAEMKEIYEKLWALVPNLGDVSDEGRDLNMVWDVDARISETMKLLDIARDVEQGHHLGIAFFDMMKQLFPSITADEASAKSIAMRENSSNITEYFNRFFTTDGKPLTRMPQAFTVEKEPLLKPIAIVTEASTEFKDSAAEAMKKFQAEKALAALEKKKSQNDYFNKVYDANTATQAKLQQGTTDDAVAAIRRQGVVDAAQAVAVAEAALAEVTKDRASAEVRAEAEAALAKAEAALVNANQALDLSNATAAAKLAEANVGFRREQIQMLGKIDEQNALAKIQAAILVDELGEELRQARADAIRKTAELKALEASQAGKEERAKASTALKVAEGKVAAKEEAIKELDQVSVDRNAHSVAAAVEQYKLGQQHGIEQARLENAQLVAQAVLAKLKSGEAINTILTDIEHKSILTDQYKGEIDAQGVQASVDQARLSTKKYKRLREALEALTPKYEELALVKPEELAAVDAKMDAQLVSENAETIAKDVEKDVNNDIDTARARAEARAASASAAKAASSVSSSVVSSGSRPLSIAILTPGGAPPPPSPPTHPSIADTADIAVLFLSLVQFLHTIGIPIRRYERDLLRFRGDPGAVHSADDENLYTTKNAEMDINGKMADIARIFQNALEMIKQNMNSMNKFISSTVVPTKEDLNKLVRMRESILRCIQAAQTAGVVIKKVMNDLVSVDAFSLNETEDLKFWASNQIMKDFEFYRTVVISMANVRQAMYIMAFTEILKKFDAEMKSLVPQLNSAFNYIEDYSKELGIQTDIVPSARGLADKPIDTVAKGADSALVIEPEPSTGPTKSFIEPFIIPVILICGYIFISILWFSMVYKYDKANEFQKTTYEENTKNLPMEISSLIARQKNVLLLKKGLVSSTETTNATFAKDMLEANGFTYNKVADRFRGSDGKDLTMDGAIDAYMTLKGYKVDTASKRTPASRIDASESIYKYESVLAKLEEDFLLSPVSLPSTTMNNSQVQDLLRQTGYSRKTTTKDWQKNDVALPVDRPWSASTQYAIEHLLAAQGFVKMSDDALKEALLTDAGYTKSGANWTLNSISSTIDVALVEVLKKRGVEIGMTQNANTWKIGDIGTISTINAVKLVLDASPRRDSLFVYTKTGLPGKIPQRSILSYFYRKIVSVQMTIKDDDRRRILTSNGYTTSAADAWTSPTGVTPVSSNVGMAVAIDDLLESRKYTSKLVFDPSKGTTSAPAKKALYTFESDATTTSNFFPILHHGETILQDMLNDIAYMSLKYTRREDGTWLDPKGVPIDRADIAKTASIEVAKQALYEQYLSVMKSYKACHLLRVNDVTVPFPWSDFVINAVAILICVFALAFTFYHFNPYQLAGDIVKCRECISNLKSYEGDANPYLVTCGNYMQANKKNNVMGMEMVKVSFVIAVVVATSYLSGLMFSSSFLYGDALYMFSADPSTAPCLD